MNLDDISPDQIPGIRFSEDKERSVNLQFPRLDDLRLRLGHAHLEVGAAITPKLEILLQEVLLRTGIERALVVCFIENSAQVDASCILCDEGKCVLQLSSSLINLMSENEIRFVLGHELGHLIFQHASGQEKAEDLWLKRASEITSDRVGLIAAGSAEDSLSAMLKTLSGLDEKFLRFDIAEFVSQRATSQKLRQQNELSTHPSFFVRARALLHFSSAESLEAEQISKVDRRVTRDFGNFIDRSHRVRLETAKNEISFWKFISLVSDGQYELDDCLLEVVGSEYGLEKKSAAHRFIRESESNAFITEESGRRAQLLINEIEMNYPALSRDAVDEAVSKAYIISESLTRVS